MLWLLAGDARVDRVRAAVHAWTVRGLPLVHPDPFDRLLAAQAICERATIVSGDAVFDAHAAPRMW